MLLLRDVNRRDLDGLKRLAAELNSVNLPHDERVLRQLIDKSMASFSGREKDITAREYLFVLEDLRNHLLVGTSMIIAQHGTKEAPHIYFQVRSDESYSATLDRHFRHRVLSIGYNYQGPTEVGGLVVDPPYRSGPDKVGKQLSYVRFLFIAMHRPLFRSRVLAELMPPLLPDGRSRLWESIGKKFTGLDYPEADKLSRQNKEFIKELFPSSDIPVSMLPLAVQRVIGEVGDSARGVQRMLERIGFRYVNHIDPFDGGPHYEADVADVSLVRKFRTATVGRADLHHEADEYVVGRDRGAAGNRFRAVKTPVRFEDSTAYLPRDVKTRLGVKPGDPVSMVPFE